MCASACFFIWMAGVERQGDAVIVHRPYFDREDFSRLSLADAAKSLAALRARARDYLLNVGAPAALIDRVFSIPSDKGQMLSRTTVEELRSAAFWEELQIAQCGSTPQAEAEQPGDKDLVFAGPYKYLTAAKRREIIKGLRRESCWRKRQADFFKQVLDEYARLPID